MGVCAIRRAEPGADRHEAGQHGHVAAREHEHRRWPVKLANIVVIDDGLGTNNLSVCGPDAASFQIIGTALFLRAGTHLDSASRPTYNVTVAVDDPAGGRQSGCEHQLRADDHAVGRRHRDADHHGSRAVVERQQPGRARGDWFEVTNVGTARRTSPAGRWTTARPRSDRRGADWHHHHRTWRVGDLHRDQPAHTTACKADGVPVAVVRRQPAAEPAGRQLRRHRRRPQHRR